MHERAQVPIAVAICVLLAAGCARDSSTTADRATVEHVSDGDTITLSGLGKTRLIGIDTPEVYGGTECFGRAASAFTKRLLPAGREVRYRIGTEPRDRYGRALAYVWLRDGRMVNELLVERGYARPYTFRPNDDFAPLFRAADRRARRRRLGLWARGRRCARQAGDHQVRSSGGDRDCADFHTRAEAQRYFDGRGGGSSNDVDHLDGGDHDGRVCESLPGS